MKADIGLIGLAVMGENLVLNMERRGYRVAVYNRTTSKVDHFTQGRAQGKNIVGTHSLEELSGSLSSPKKVMMMVKAGQPVDSLIDMLIPLLEPGDILIDGGNSNYMDTIRRTALVESHGLLYVGSGVSGGEEGALKGPSIMPGGSVAAWDQIGPIFQSISAKAPDGSPCCDWVGSDGAGHFVKMVHNGIEYGDMQLICEAYFIMKELLHMSADEMQQTFARWNSGVLDSYLMEITANILSYKDEDGQALVEKILDTAGQKGTGKWTAISALDQGIPLTLIGEAVFARCLSALKEERMAASKLFSAPTEQPQVDKQTFLDSIENALYASKIISYAQGFALLKQAAHEYSWDLDYGKIALSWRGGCIIRSAFLSDIKTAYDKQPELNNLLLDPTFSQRISGAISGLRQVCAMCAQAGIPAPAYYSALSYFDGYRSASLPANMLQAQRDYFGAHTYERIDRPRGEFFHTDWTGEGGDTASTTYNA